MCGLGTVCRIGKDLQRFARICVDLEGFVRIRKDLKGFVRICKVFQGFVSKWSSQSVVKNCKNLLKGVCAEYAQSMRAQWGRGECKDLQGFTKICNDL